MYLNTDMKQEPVRGESYRKFIIRLQLDNDGAWRASATVAAAAAAAGDQLRCIMDARSSLAGHQLILTIYDSWLNGQEINED